MPFQKGFNRWALPHDELDIESMKLSMAFNAWGIPAFKKLFMYDDVGIMDYNDILSLKNKHCMHAMLVNKAPFLFMLAKCAPSLRIRKPDLLAMR